MTNLDETTTLSVSTRWFGWWRSRGNLSPEARRAVLDAVALRPSRASTMRFAILQALSVVIAVMGLTTNSAAVVIGAMLVAPLMGPIMGVSASLAMGWGTRAARTAALVTLAGAGSVALAYVLSALVPGDGITEEVLARTAPGATDLVIALAAGLAGAYATVRPDISASLPGVAVAVALVPPLATVGVTWQAHENGLATGALLLFATNLAAIVFAGLVVFPLTGFVPARRMHHVKGNVVLHAAGVTTVVVLLTALLTSRTIDAANQADDDASTRRLVTGWLTGTGLELTDLAIHDTRISIDVAGPDAPPEPSSLARQLTEVLGREAELEIQWLQRSSIAANGNGLSNIDRDVILTEVDAWLAETVEDPDAFDVEVDIEPRSVVVAVAGPVAPPDQRSLERRLSSQLGITIPVTVDATVTVPDAETRDDLDAAANTAAIWATERNVTVASAAMDGDIVTIIIEGPTPPREAATLAARLSTELRRPIELRLQHRTVSVVPTDAVHVFHWPLDCTAQATATATTPATRGFTATPLGAWLSERLAAGTIPFLDDGSSFAHNYADGTLHVWAALADTQSVVPLGEMTLDRAGPRDREFRSASIGPVALWAAVVPHDIDGITTTTCLPTTAELDAWFATVVETAAASPYSGDLNAYRPATPTTDTAPRHLLRVASTARLPLSITVDGHLTILVNGIHVPVDLTTGLTTTSLEGIRTRSGGLTVDAHDSSATAQALLDRLAVALAADPFVGAPREATFN